jgi:hypothetical protein
MAAAVAAVVAAAAGGINAALGSARETVQRLVA